jgi:hypothetical protein
MTMNGHCVIFVCHLSVTLAHLAGVVYEFFQLMVVEHGSFLLINFLLVIVFSGMMSLEILAALESHLPPGKRLHDVFDMMVGVSTGAIMCALLGAFRLTVPECKRIYRCVDLNKKLFQYLQ